MPALKLVKWNHPVIERDRTMTTFFRETELDFPDCDGKPMAENTVQFQWIVLIKENLEILFVDDPNVFIAGDLLWYPIKSRLITPVAPDAMVVFGRPKGRRGSYKQWEEDNIPAQVTFEILSPSNDDREMARKLEFYDTYGVEEYYLYDPDTNDFEGWIRSGEHLEPIGLIDGWTSPLLEVRFVTSTGELEIYRSDGRKLLTSIKLDQQFEQERTRAEVLQSELNAERQRTEQLAEYLRSLGIDPNTLP